MKKTCFPGRVLATSVVALLVQLTGTHGATWSLDADGTWSTPTNWLGGVPNAVDAIADANTLDITANRTITLDGSFTVGTLRFGDSTASNDWLLLPPSGNTTNAITLDVSSGAPTLDVVNRNAIIGVPLAGSKGMTKTGAGTAFLTGANNYTGTTTVSAGALILGTGGTAGSLASTQIVNSVAAGSNAPGGFEIRRSDWYAVPFSIVNPTNNTASGSLTINSGAFSSPNTGVSIAGVVRQGTVGVGRIGFFGRLFVENGADMMVGNYFFGEQSGRIGQGIQNGGAINVTGQMRVGHWPQTDPLTGSANTTTPNTYTMNGGTLTLTGTFTGNPQGTTEKNGILYLGIDSTGELTVNGGTIDTKAIVLDNRAATNGTDRLTVNGGTIRVGGVGPGNDANTANIGSAIISNNTGTTYAVSYTGGTIQATGSFLHAVDVTLSNTNGGITFDSNGAGNTITASGVFSGSGGLTKTGAGALLLNATNTYSGTTTVSGGALQVNGSLPGAGSVVVNGTGSIGGAGDGVATGVMGNVTVNAGGGIRPGESADDGSIGTITMAGLSFVGGNARLDLSPTDFTTGFGINDLIAVNGPVTLNGGTITPVWSGSPTTGTYTILTSTGLTATQLPTVSLPASRQTYTVGVNGNNVQLTVGGSAPLNLTWSGGLNNNVWDVNSTANWRQSAPNDQKFFNFDSVTFGEVGAGVAIDIPQPVQPGSTTVNASLNYTFGGAGGIAAGSLTKDGVGTLLLLTNNSYTGATTIVSGTIQVGNGGTAGTLGGLGVITNDGTLAFNRSDAVTIDRQIIGSGKVVKDGAGVLLLTGVNGYLGGTILNAGVLKMGNSSALGANGSLVTIANGATLDVNGVASGADRYDLVVSGAGLPGQAAIWNGGGGVTNNPIFRSITLTGDTTIGNNSRYDLNGGAGGVTFSGDTFTLTKVGTGETWWSPNPGASVGNIVVDGGIFGVQSSFNLGSDAHSIIVNPSGQLYSYSAVSNSKPIILNGGLLAANNSTGAWSGTVTLQGAGTSNRIGVVSAGVGVTLMGQITGPGGFEKVNGGVVDLQSPSNDWQGDTRISAGTLQLSFGGILSPKTTLDMNGGTLNLNLSDQTVAGLKGATGLIQGDGTLTVAQAADSTFGGVIEGITALVKSGSGSLTLSGNSTTAGTTTVGAGSLVVNGSLNGSRVTVNGGKLGGTGTVGELALNAAGTLAPGVNTGILHAGNTTFNGGTFALELNGTTPGTGYDQLGVAGTFGLAVNTVLSITLGFDPVDNVDRFVIVDNDFTEPVTTTGFFTLNSQVLTEGASFTVGDQKFRISYAGGVDNNDVVLFAIPEPGVVASLLGCGVLLGLRRFRCAK
ncbi:beta strand repeat-containing protein [Verrucomicrobiota bacterium sgz303538]